MTPFGARAGRTQTYNRYAFADGDADGAAAAMSRGAVLVTGASSGIGEATARELVAHGFDVVAGVRRDEDAERLRASVGGLEPVELDITDADAVAAVAERLAARDRGRLAGLVNNAGVVVSGPLEFLEADELRRQFEVNVFGHMTVIRALLPLLRTARGRVVNVGSIGGRLGFPFIAPYHASKAALDSLTTSLRREVRPWGIRVALIEPGTIATPIWEKGLRYVDELERRMPPEGIELYGRALQASTEITERMTGAAAPPALVGRAALHALTARRPRRRYLVGRDARALAAMTRVLPAKAMDAAVSRQMGW